MSGYAKWLLLLSFAMLLGLSTAARAATPDQVDAAVAKGIPNLYARIATGNAEVSPAPDMTAKRFDFNGGAWGGSTAIDVLALLVAGERPGDPRLAKTIDWLKHVNFAGTYATSLRAQVWTHMDYEHSPELKALIQHDTDTLVDSLESQPGDPKDGMYNYWVQSGPMPGGGPAAEGPAPGTDIWRGSLHDGWYDHSNSQLGVLGVWSLAETNVVEIPRSYWERVEQGWMHSQYPDGAWSYRFNDHAGNPPFDVHSMNMTASGVATLYITEDYLRSDSGCNGNVDNAHIQAGVKWMAANFKDTYIAAPATDPNLAPSLKYYGFYAVERVGQASGRKYIGDDINWYQQGTDRLVGEQAADGGWGSLADTCLAMLFLCHGRAPVMLNKLEYNIDMHGDKTKEANWNQRPHDAARLARWMGKATELEFNWQIVNLRVPVDELHDAPILYLAGDQDLDFTKEEEDKLKQFCEDGGLIMFNADCGSSRFSTAVRKLGTRLFPQSEFRELPQDHPIYTEEQFKRNLWHSKLSVEGLSNGARELMILFPHDDPARLWHTGAYGGREDRHEIAADVFEYIGGKIWKLRKGDTFIVRPGAGGGGKAIKVARLQYPGMWDPEPAGWRRLAAIMHNTGKAELTVDTVNLGDGKLSGYSVAHLTGTYAVTLPGSARAELKDFVNNGGTLIIDACGGSAAFMSSMDKEMAAIFGVQGSVPILKSDNPVFAGIEKFEYRRFAQKIVGKKLATPRLRGLEINGRTAVYLSGEDLSVGLVGVPVDGIYGYEPNTACALMENILLATAH